MYHSSLDLEQRVRQYFNVVTCTVLAEDSMVCYVLYSNVYIPVYSIVGVDGGCDANEGFYSNIDPKFRTG